nr:unnamed protein product [Callosobruchus analis]
MKAFYLAREIALEKHKGLYVNSLLHSGCRISEPEETSGRETVTCSANFPGETGREVPPAAVRELITQEKQQTTCVEMRRKRPPYGLGKLQHKLTR